MEARMRVFVWAGMALLAALSLQPAGRVLASDWQAKAAIAPLERVEVGLAKGDVEETAADSTSTDQPLVTAALVTR